MLAPPLLLLRGFMTVHANPVGLQRRFEICLLAPLAQHFRVFAVGRAPGMSSGASMADLARDHAEAIRAEFGTAVDVMGVSSGGSVAAAAGRRGAQYLAPVKVAHPLVLACWRH